MASTVLNVLVRIEAKHCDSVRFERPRPAFLLLIWTNVVRLLRDLPIRHISDSRLPLTRPKTIEIVCIEPVRRLRYGGSPVEPNITGNNDNHVLYSKSKIPSRRKSPLGLAGLHLVNYPGALDG
jgi:hypothetical protein